VLSAAVVFPVPVQDRGQDRAKDLVMAYRLDHTVIYALLALAVVCAVILFVFNQGAH